MGFNKFGINTFSEDFIRESDVGYVLSQIAVKAHSIKQRCGKSFRRIATEMGLQTTSSIQRLVNGGKPPHNMTIDTLVRFAKACGCTLVIDFVMETPKYGIPVEYTMMHEGDTQHIGYSMGARTCHDRLKISETMWDGKCESFDHIAIKWRYIGEKEWRD